MARTAAGAQTRRGERRRLKRAQTGQSEEHQRLVGRGRNDSDGPPRGDTVVACGGDEAARRPARPPPARPGQRAGTTRTGRGAAARLLRAARSTRMAVARGAAVRDRARRSKNHCSIIRLSRYSPWGPVSAGGRRGPPGPAPDRRIRVAGSESPDPSRGTRRTLRAGRKTRSDGHPTPPHAAPRQARAGISKTRPRRHGPPDTKRRIHRPAVSGPQPPARPGPEWATNPSPCA